ncbi:MAG: phosphotransferase [Pseudomonadota bacterium]
MLQIQSDSDDALSNFLHRAGWAGADITPLAGDASSRSFKRVRNHEHCAILMIAPPGAETAACPPEASPEDRRALGYNASARLAGPSLAPFIAITGALRHAGLSAPEIYAVDEHKGYALIEDLGDALYARAVEQYDERLLYHSAVEALLQLKHAKLPRPAFGAYKMLDYDGLALRTEAALFSEWYWPLKTNTSPPDDFCAEFNSIIDEMTGALSLPSTIVLRDYHAENLLWLPGRDGIARTGVIDFQDGLFGSPAYDLASLLEDARRDVSASLADHLLTTYADRGFSSDKALQDAFKSDYAIVAAQRNAKILGVFARLAKRDQKPRYLDFLPRVEAHFRRDLERPEAQKLKTFLAPHFPDLAA